VSVNVAVLMPTLPGRTDLRSRALASYHTQYLPSEWNVSLYVDADPVLTLGGKLNRMIANCSEEYIILLDDDDWHSRDRIARQVEPLLRGYDVSGTSQIYYQDGKEAWLYKGDGTWLGGMAFKRSLWERLKFEDLSIGCDTRWQKSLMGTAKFYDLEDPTLFIALIHAGNTSKKVVSGPNWKQVDYSVVKGWIWWA
jgi:glycosyltransferase involved in cell wall biosynthesis